MPSEQLGDSIDTVQRTYVHVIEELLGQQRASAEKTIRAARRRVTTDGVPKVFPEPLRERAASG